MKSNILALIALFVFSISFAQEANHEDLKWPRELDTEKGKAVFYQPQLDSFTGNILEGRCAVSFTPTDGEIIFGAFWFRAFLQTDTEQRTAVLDQIDILQVQFPGLEDDDKIEKVKTSIQTTIESMNFAMSLDRLKASLNDLDDMEAMADNLDNTPPNILYRAVPTILISIDGQPIWKEVKDSGLKFAQNSAFFIAQDIKSQKYFISGGGNWYTSASPDQPWQLTEKVPSGIKKFASENAPEKSETSSVEEPPNPPEIVVVSKPSELVVTSGEPDYRAIEGTSLLFVENTESDIIMDINTQIHYVLIAGRWYKSKTLSDGDWTFANPKELPADFKNIPTESEMANVRQSVPNTEEARDALLEQSIPQTAEVVRSEAKVDVKFDGDPKFKQIPNTDVAYSENSDKSVLKIDQKFYVVDNGIWFISNYPGGPYEVSDHRPDEVDQIPPTEPVYNTKYVYVYSSTPEVVYVGYLPGYTHSYVYNGVVVYGTGYHYPYWYGSVYYPRPMTYGYSVHYNPYTGWGFSVGFSSGWIGWSCHPYYRPYWGPCGYRAGYRHGYHHGYNHGYRAGYNRGAAAGYRAGQRNAYNNQRAGVKKSTYNKQQLANRKDLSRPTNGKNNVYSDKKGNVYQRDNKGNWDQKSKPATRDQSRPNAGNNKAGDIKNKGDINKRPAGGNTERPTTRPATNPTTNPSNKPTTRPSTKPSTRPSTQPSQKHPSSTRPSTQPSQQRPSSTRPSTQPSRQSPSGLDRSHQNRQQGQQNYNRQQQSRSQPARTAPSRAPQRSAPSRGGGGRRR